MIEGQREGLTFDCADDDHDNCDEADKHAIEEVPAVTGLIFLGKFYLNFHLVFGLEMPLIIFKANFKLVGLVDFGGLLDSVHDDEYTCEEEGQSIPAFVVVLEFLIGVVGVIGGYDAGVGGIEGDEVGEHHQSSCCH